MTIHSRFYIFRSTLQSDTNMQTLDADRSLVSIQLRRTSAHLG